MKNCAKSILFAGYLLLVCSTVSQAAVIAINPGHQAKANLEKEAIGPSSKVMKYKVTAGTRGVYTHIPESELNLQNAMYLKKELVMRGHKVIMIRETNDVNISNAERVQAALQGGAELIISLHANACGAKQSKDSHGIMTLCRKVNNPFNASLYAKERHLADCVQTALCNATGAKNIGVIETDNMTGINYSSVPSIIIEVGYMTNAEEDKLMATEEYRAKIAYGIAEGIKKYLVEGDLQSD